MNINVNEKDDNLVEIHREAKFTGMETKNQFRIYGLAQEGNPPVLFSAQEAIINSEQEKAAISFLKSNGIDAEMEEVDTKKRQIYIGLRRDLRQDIKLSALLLQTLVYYFEGRIVDLPPDFKILGIPEYKTVKAG